MDERETVTIGDLLARDGGSVKTGPFGTTLKAHEYSSVGVPIISVGEVGYGRLRLREDTPRADAELVARLPEYLLNGGDIVFGRKGAVDRSALVLDSQTGWFLGSDGIRLRLPPTVDARFVAYQLQSPRLRAWVVQHATGTTMPSLNQGVIERIPITLPDLAEQTRIADILGALDDKIELDRDLVQILRRVAQSAGSAALGGDPVPLGAIADLQRGFGYSSAGLSESGTPMISMGTTERRGWLKRTGLRRYADPVKPKYHVGPWDLLVVNVDLTWKLEVLGWPLLVPSDLPDAVVSNDIYAIRLHERQAWKRSLVWAALQSPAARGWLEGAAKGTTVASLAAADVLALSIPIEDSASARRLAATAETAIERAWAAEREVETLQSIRDALLPWLLLGAV